MRKAPPPPPPLKWGPVSGVPLRLHNLTLRLTWSTVDSLPARLVNFRSTVNKAEQDLHNSTPCLTNQPTYMFTQQLTSLSPSFAKKEASFDNALILDMPCQFPPQMYIYILLYFWQAQTSPVKHSSPKHSSTGKVSGTMEMELVGKGFYWGDLFKLAFLLENMRIYNLRCELVDAVLSHRPPFPIQGKT